MTTPRKPSATPPKARVLIVFGRIDAAAPDRAGWFGPGAADTAKLTAQKFGLKCLPVATFEQHELAKTLPEGVLNAQGQFSLPPAAPAVIEKLEALSAEPGKATGPETTMDAGGAQPVRGAGPLPQATVSAHPASPWENLRVGAVVLGAAYGKKGEYEGFWEAEVVKIEGDEFHLRWYGVPKTEPLTRHERKYLALIHPDYAKEF